jgi:hypothetical protein
VLPRQSPRTAREEYAAKGEEERAVAHLLDFVHVV